MRHLLTIILTAWIFTQAVAPLSVWSDVGNIWMEIEYENDAEKKKEEEKNEKEEEKKEKEEKLIQSALIEVYKANLVHFCNLDHQDLRRLIIKDIWRPPRI